MKIVGIFLCLTFSSFANADYDETARRADAYHSSAEYRAKVEAERSERAAREAANFNKTFQKSVRVFVKKYHRGFASIPQFSFKGSAIDFMTFHTGDNLDCKAFSATYLVRCISPVTYEEKAEIMWIGGTLRAVIPLNR